jgi:hypothetical protein
MIDPELLKDRNNFSDSRVKEPGGAMVIGGISIIVVLGFVNFLLLLFQVATGLRWVKVRFGVHRKAGILLFIIATIHGLLGMLAG